MTLDQIKHLIAKEFNFDITTLSRDTRLEEDLNIDSLDAVELVMELEDTFQLSISDEIAQTFKTIGHIADFVAEKIGS